MSRKQKVFHALGMSVIMSFFMSLVMGIKALGITPVMWAELPLNVFIGIVVSFPLSLVVPGLLTRLMHGWNIR